MQPERADWGISVRRSDRASDAQDALNQVLYWLNAPSNRRHPVLWLLCERRWL